MPKRELLFRYGRDILESEYFSAAKVEVHHLFSTVASHSIHTAMVCISISRILKVFHIRLNLSVLIPAALAHDLGMIGRNQKYSTNMEAYRKHPDVSVQIMRILRPEADRRIYDAIATHMYPVTPKKPASKEAWALCLADKCAACSDWFCNYD